MRAGRFYGHPPKPIGRLQFSFGDPRLPLLNCSSIPSIIHLLFRHLEQRPKAKKMGQDPAGEATEQDWAGAQHLCSLHFNSVCVKTDDVLAPAHKDTINTLMIIVSPENMVMKVVVVSTTITSALTSTYQLSLSCRASLGRDPVAEPGVTLSLCPPAVWLGWCPSGDRDVTLLCRTSTEDGDRCFWFISLIMFHMLWDFSESPPLLNSITTSIAWPVPSAQQTQLPKGTQGTPTPECKVFGDDPAVSPAQLLQMSTSRKAEPALQPQVTIP